MMKVKMTNYLRKVLAVSCGWIDFFHHRWTIGGDGDVCVCVSLGKMAAAGFIVY